MGKEDLEINQVYFYNQPTNDYYPGCTSLVKYLGQDQHEFWIFKVLWSEVRFTIRHNIRFNYDQLEHLTLIDENLKYFYE